jgi:hypothetical protein
VESIKTYAASATPSGAALLGVLTEQAGTVNAGLKSARMPNPVLVAGLDERCIAFISAPAPTTRLVPLAARPAAARPATAMPAKPLPSVNHAQKQSNVHKTRISVGGYGAMGPHPEREPA